MRHVRPLAVCLVTLLLVSGCLGEGASHDTPDAAHLLGAAFGDLGLQIGARDSGSILDTTHSWVGFEPANAGEILRANAETAEKFLDEHSDEKDLICAVVVYRNDNGEWPTDPAAVGEDLLSDKLSPPSALADNFLLTLSVSEARFGSGNGLDAALQGTALYCEGEGILKRVDS